MIRNYFFAVLLLSMMAACGGGGGGGGNGAGVPPPADSQVLGTLNVAPTNRIETEANNSPATAQPLAPGESVIGSAGAGEPGHRGITARSTVVIQDL